MVGAGLCFVSGQFGIDEDNRPVGTVEQQTALALDHIDAVLRQAGSSLANVVRMTVWLTSLDDFEKVNAVYRTRFYKEPPARVTVEAAKLLFGAAVEMDAIAIVPSARQQS